MTDPIPTPMPLEYEILQRSNIAAYYMSGSVSRYPSSIELVTGVMGGGKSRTIGKVAEIVENPMTIYKLSGDTRFGSGSDSIGARNRPLITGDIRPVGFATGIDQILDDVTSGQFGAGHVLGMVEGAFIAHGQPDKVARLGDEIRKRNLHLKVDSLGAWYTTHPIEETLAFAKLADRVFLMHAWDDLQPSEPADTNMRLVGIDAAGEIIAPHQQDAVYLGKTDKPMRLLMLRNLIKAGYGKLITMQHPEGAEDIEECYGLPSHPIMDPNLALGSDRYRSLSLHNYRLVYSSTGMNISDIQPGSITTSLAQFNNLHNWINLN